MLTDAARAVESDKRWPVPDVYVDAERTRLIDQMLAATVEH